MAFLHLEGSDPPHDQPLGNRLTIGRSPECDLVISDSSISRRHATVTQSPEGFRLKDEGSRFGSFVNGAAAENTLLRDGDEVRLGNILLTFRAGDLPKAGAPTSGKNFGTSQGTEARVAELEGRVAELTLSHQKSQALLSLHEAFQRCTSPGMVLQAVAPDVLRLLRPERAGFFLLDPHSGRMVCKAQHHLSRPPDEGLEPIRAALESGEISFLPSGPGGREVVIAPLVGADLTPHGLIYAEAFPGKQLALEEKELLRAMVTGIAGAIAALVLSQKARREEQARADLSRYVSNQVAEAVLSGKISLNLGGEKRSVTVLFLDVRGFTALSEKLPPEHVLAILNEYFAECVPVIKEAQGTVDKFIGDALMAVFGAPNDMPDQRLRAVQAAIHIQKKVSLLRDRWKDKPWAAHTDVSRFAVGAGVNTGLVVAGNLGTEERKEYAVIGDTVNVASRLCANAGPDQILIGAETAAGLGGSVGLRGLEPLKVKGRAKPVEAFEVLDRWA